MGQKITINSASMMNKGLEVIEASYLFALSPDEIDVLVHPQSIIHGMVEFSDRSVVAQLGSPDMRTPIAHCLGWPDRIKGPAAKLDLAKIGQLTFEAPDFERFPGCGWPSICCGPGRGRPPSTTPPTRSRSPLSSPARSGSARSPGWSRRRWTTGFAAEPGPADVRGRCNLC